jgi:hypothetical protein
MDPATSRRRIMMSSDIGQSAPSNQRWARDRDVWVLRRIHGLVSKYLLSSRSRDSRSRISSRSRPLRSGAHVRAKDINNPKGRWGTRHSKRKLPRDALWAFCDKTKTYGRGFSAGRHHFANYRPARVGVSQRD